MPFIRLQVFMKKPTDLPRDGASNTLYFDRTGGILPTDYEAIATDVMEIYQGMNFWQGWNYDVRAYNDEAPKGTPPEARITGTFTGGAIQATAPREVALCLSYRTDPPYTSRRRGRIYIGPFPQNTVAIERPAPALMTAVLGMGEAFAEIGGEDVSWRIKSEVNNDNHHIRYCWVDNSWDTVRGRGQAPNSRTGAEV